MNRWEIVGRRALVLAHVQSAMCNALTNLRLGVTLGEDECDRRSRRRDHVRAGSLGSRG